VSLVSDISNSLLLTPGNRSGDEMLRLQIVLAIGGSVSTLGSSFKGKLLLAASRLEFRVLAVISTARIG
jgi:hypothetical protein